MTTTASSFDGFAVADSSLVAKIVCCPSAATDLDVLEFAEHVDPAGTVHGWQITEDPLSVGKDQGWCPYRDPCQHRPGNVHIRINV